MFYKNINNKKFSKVQEVRAVDFNKSMVSSDLSNVPFGSCAEQFNFNSAGGVLTDGMGFEDVILRGHSIDKSLNISDIRTIEGSYFFRLWNDNANLYFPILMLYKNTKTFAYNNIDNDSSDLINIANMTIPNKPIVLNTKINGIDMVILCEKSQSTAYLWGMGYSSGVSITLPTKITSMCVHNNRMFLTSSVECRSVLFSEELNPLNFNVADGELGYINMTDNGGKCNKLLSFKGDLYVIKDYNISRIRVDGARKSFEVEHIDVGINKIFEDTVVVCGDKIVYLTSNGLYEFNGTRATKINLDIDNKFSHKNEQSLAEYYDGDYYLSTKLTYDTDMGFKVEKDVKLNNALIKLNLETKEYTLLRGISVTHLTAVRDGRNNCLIINFRENTLLKNMGIVNMSGENRGNKIAKFWRSAISDMGMPLKNKFIKEVTLTTKTDMVLGLNLDGKTTEFGVKGSDKPQKIRINKKAKNIGYFIKTDCNNTYITPPVFVVGTL